VIWGKKKKRKNLREEGILFSYNFTPRRTLLPVVADAIKDFCSDQVS
jgi:hypothetical protein